MVSVRDSVVSGRDAIKYLELNSKQMLRKCQIVGWCDIFFRRCRKMVVWNKQIKCDDTEFPLLSFFFLTETDSNGLPQFSKLHPGNLTFTSFERLAWF